MTLRQCKFKHLYSGDACPTCAQWEANRLAYNARCNDNAPPMPEPERDTREHLREAGARMDVWSDPRAGR